MNKKKFFFDKCINYVLWICLECNMNKRVGIWKIGSFFYDF